MLDLGCGHGVPVAESRFAGSAWTVVVEAGALEAIVFVLLHEAPHMVDGALGLTPVEGRRPEADAAVRHAGCVTGAAERADAGPHLCSRGDDELVLSARQR